MKSLEKNDVDISRLFHWGDVLEINNLMGETVIRIYMRVIGDADVNRARVQALRFSNELRKNLNDKAWEDREAYIPDVSAFSKEDLIQLIVTYSSRDIISRASADIVIPHPKEPSGDANLEEQELYQKKTDEYPKIFEEKLRIDVDKRIASFKEVLEEKTTEELIQMHESEMIKEMCNVRFLDRYQELCAFYGTYKDSEYKKRLFDDFQKFLDSPKLLKGQVVNNYSVLELNAEALKKSLGATL